MDMDFIGNEDCDTQTAFSEDTIFSTIMDIVGCIVFLSLTAGFVYMAITVCNL